MKIKSTPFLQGLTLLMLSFFQFKVSSAADIPNSQPGKVSINKISCLIKTAVTSSARDTVPDRSLPAPVVAIGLDKMNVFYIGIDNPVTIAVAGVETKNVVVSIAGGTITGSNGKYIVRVSAPGKASIKVAEIINGKPVSSGEYFFRVKHIPTPVNGKIPFDMDAKATVL